MNMICTVAAIVVAVAAVARLLWWAYGRSHQLAVQRQSPTANPAELGQTGQGPEVNGKAPGEANSQKK